MTFKSMQYRSWILAVVLLSVGAACLEAAETPAKKSTKPVSFAKQIAPILARRCLACHAARIAKGRIDLENYAAIMRGGADGPTIVPDDADSSTLFAVVQDGSMPDGDDSLSAAEIRLIKTWIDQGAVLEAGIEPRDSLWNIIPRKPQPPPPNSYRVPMPVTALAFSPDGKLLASSGYHEVLLWDAANGRLIRRIANVAERTFAINFHPDGKRIAVASGTPGEIGEAKLFRVADGKLVRHFVTAQGSMFAVRFSPDGKRLATGGSDRVIRVFSTNDGRQLFHMPDHHKAVMDLAWSPDGSRLASASRDKNAKVFDMQTGRQLVTYNKSAESNFAGMIFGVGFAADGKQVASCGNDHKIRIWNVKDAKLVRAIDGHSDSVVRLAISPDNRVFSCGADNSVRIHDLRTGKAIRMFNDHSDCVYSIAIHTTTNRLASGSYDGEVRIRTLDKGSQTVAFVAAPGYKVK